LEECGYRIEWKLINSADYGVLQERKRLILIGRKGLLAFDYPEFEEWHPKSWTTKNALFSDLRLLKQGQGFSVSNYRTERANDYLEKATLRNGINCVTQHITRPHNGRDLEIYSIAIDKWLNYRERLRYNDLPTRLKTHNNETAFLDRFKVVDPDGCSHTIVAHIAKDGHYFIYPDINSPRSLSVREAARIQSFPDDFFFEGGRSNAFKKIGNAVPPLMAEAIAKKLTEFF
jgi:DNA (cytosine-5)-methyltransferase 1